MGALLAIALVVQFRSVRHGPSIYWLAVVLISVVGTLITDNLTDNFGVGLETTIIVFAAAGSLLLADDSLHLRPGHRCR